MSASPDPRPADPRASHPTSDGAAPVRSWRLGFSGLRVHVEECPEGSRDGVKAVAGGGIAGWGLSAILGSSRSGRILGTLVGAASAAALARFHVRVDWDPDEARGGGLGGLRVPTVQGPDA